MDQTIDSLSFSIVRILSGALTLLVVLTLSSQSKSNSKPKQDSYNSGISGYTKLKSQIQLTSILSLLVYMFGLSFAYLELGAGLGALVLFVAVQFVISSTVILLGISLVLVAPKLKK
jgi:hypothetical protein